VNWQVIVISQANRLNLTTASHNIILFTSAEMFIIFFVRGLEIGMKIILFCYWSSTILVVGIFFVTRQSDHRIFTSYSRKSEK